MNFGGKRPPGRNYLNRFKWDMLLLMCNMLINANRRRIRANLPILVVSVVLIMIFTPIVKAADFSAVEVVNSYKLADKSAVDGDLISSTKNGLIRSTIPFDSQLFGVVSLKPLGAYRSLDAADVPVARNGTANVNVTTLGGKITRGGVITTSEDAGKGQNANM